MTRSPADTMERSTERLAVITLRLLDHLDGLEAGRNRGTTTFRQTARQIARAHQFFPAEDALAHRMLRLHEQRTRCLRIQAASRRAEPITLTLFEPTFSPASDYVPLGLRALRSFRRIVSAFRAWLVHPLVVLGPLPAPTAESDDLDKAA